MSTYQGATPPAGVTYSSTTSTDSSKDFIKILGSAAVGYGAGYYQGKNNRNNNNGNNNCGCNNFNGNCSENTPVNRFELQQSEKMAEKDARIARLESESAMKDYTNSAILELRKEFISANDKQDSVTARLIQSTIDLDKLVAGLDKEVMGIDKAIVAQKEAIEKQFECNAKAVNREFLSIRERFVTEREISNDKYIPQPKTVVCASKYEIKCENDVL